jgi:hypothetical protein
MLSLIRLTMVSTTRVEDTAAVEEGAERVASAAPREEKEKQASAGSVTPPPTKSLKRKLNLEPWLKLCFGLKKVKRIFCDLFVYGKLWSIIEIVSNISLA